tara:strand:+ start:270 stop:494 length:225 start_codon:yes stop_codon:yes gene_type:complete
MGEYLYIIAAILFFITTIFYRYRCKIIVKDYLNISEQLREEKIQRTKAEYSFFYFKNLAELRLKKILNKANENK